MNQSHNTPLLIGLIIDVSSSMRRNMKNSDGRPMPRIEVIRDALNRQFQKSMILQDSTNNKRPIEVFCIGMGFKRPMVWSDVRISYGEEEVLNSKGEKKIDTSVVCDVLALAEMIPNKNQLQDIEAQIRAKWNAHAEEILGKVDINENVFDDLEVYIVKSISESVINKAFNWIHDFATRIQFQALETFVLNIIEKVQDRKNRINLFSQIAGQKYIEKMFSHSKKAFENEREHYLDYIRSKLDSFAEKYSKEILQLFTLGHDPYSIINNFNSDLVQQLATDIYKYLDGRLQTRISDVWFDSNKTLFFDSLNLGAAINPIKVKALTEKCVQKHSWDILEPFVREAVSNTFKEKFETIAKEKMPHWIGMASSREIIRDANHVSVLLPDGLDEMFYDDEFMFGSTPVDDAMNIASLRFLDANNANKERILILISDGEFETDAQLRTVELLKKEEGIQVACCYLVGKDLISKLQSVMIETWPDGAKKMFELSSTVGESNSLLKELAERGRSTNRGNKLLFQINESKTLEFIFEHFLSQ